MLYIVGASGKLGSGLLSRFPRAVGVGRDLAVSLSEGDVVVNAAGRVEGSCRDLEEANVELPKRLLSMAEEAGAHLIHISSIAVYGDRDLGEGFDPYSEDELQARDCYGRSKLEAERALRGRASILRLGPVFGETFPIYAKMLRLLRRGPVPLVGGGGNHIPFTYIGDVARAVALLAERREPLLEVLAGPGARQREVWELAGQLLGVEPSFVPIPTPLARALGRLCCGEHIKVLSRHRLFPPPRLLNPTPFPTALREVVEAFKRRGML